MAGRKVLARLSAEIEAKGGDSYIFDKVVDGVPIRQIMGEFDLSHGMLYHWLRAGGEERQKGYELAKKASAEAHAEHAEEIYRRAYEQGNGAAPAHVTAAANYAKYKQWLAGKRDREQFGEAKDQEVNVTLSFGAAHLEALKELGSMDRQREQIPEADIELLEEDTDADES